MLNRRQLVQRLAALTAGVILPPTLTENAEAVWSVNQYGERIVSRDQERRYWALDQTMLPDRRSWWTTTHLADPGYEWDAWIRIGPHDWRFEYAPEGQIIVDEHRFDMTLEAGGRLIFRVDGGPAMELPPQMPVDWNPTRGVVRGVITHPSEAHTIGLMVAYLP